jgi:hypothetical protein
MNSKFSPSEFLLILTILGVITGGLAVVNFSKQPAQDQVGCVEFSQAPECYGSGSGGRGVINPARSSGQKSGPSDGSVSGKSSGRSGFGSFGRGGFGGG